MKRFLTSSIFLIIFSVSFCSLEAQDNKFKREWNIGASFGANLSDATFQTSASAEPFKTSMWMQYQAGLSVRFITENHLGFIVEMNYAQQGWKQNFEKDDIDVEEAQIRAGLEHKHQLNYLEVPFLTHIYFGNKVRFFINLGPKLGFLISEKETYNDNLTNWLASGAVGQGETTDQFFKKAETKIDYGIVAGLGLEFRTGIGYFAIEGRYNFGLGDFYKNKKSDHFQRSANTAIGIKMTYYTKIF